MTLSGIETHHLPTFRAVPQTTRSPPATNCRGKQTTNSRRILAFCTSILQLEKPNFFWKNVRSVLSRDFPFSLRPGKDQSKAKKVDTPPPPPNSFHLHLISLLTYSLTHSLTPSLPHSMQQSPSWPANCFAASQEIPHISGNPKVHYCTHKRPPIVSILGQPNPVRIPTSHLLEIHPNIIHPSTRRSPLWSLSFRFPYQTLYTPLFSPIHATCTANLILLDFITRTILGEQYRSFHYYQINWN